MCRCSASVIATTREINRRRATIFSIFTICIGWWSRANASNLLHSRGAGQGFRKKIGVQGGSFAFAGDAVFPRMLLEQAQRHFSHQGEVLSRVTVLDATLILTEADIQLPM